MSQPFDTWDDRYRTADFYYGLEPNDFLKEHAQGIRSGGSVLCLAEGEGRNAVFLAGLGHAVTAVDGSRVGLEKLAGLAKSRGLHIESICADLADFDIGSQRWDAIVSIWCHLPSALRARVHQQVVVGLRPGGCLILEAYTPQQLERKTGGPPDVDRLMTLTALQRELAGLVFEIGVEKDRTVEEGRGHMGPSAVVQVLARKA